MQAVWVVFHIILVCGKKVIILNTSHTFIKKKKSFKKHHKTLHFMRKKFFLPWNIQKSNFVCTCNDNKTFSTEE